MNVSTRGNDSDAGTETKKGQRSFFDWIGSLGSEDVGVDLGTSNIVLFIRNKGLVFPESSMIAVDEKTGAPVAYGTKAEEMEGRTPRGLMVTRPLKSSAIVDYNGAAYLLNSVISHSFLKGMFFHPRLMMCIPPGINNVERRALLEAAVAMGARKTVLMDQPLATAMGMGMQKDDQLRGAMIVDIGGGSTKVSVLSRHGVVASECILDSGISMDFAILSMVMEKYHVRIGRKQAETLKIRLGAYWDLHSSENQLAEVSGISTIRGLPVKIAVSGQDVANALNPSLYRIFKCIRRVLQQIPPVLFADIRDHGIMLVGGVSQLIGLNMLITRAIGIPAYVVEHPTYVNAIGAGYSLQYMDYFRDSMQDLH